MEESNAEHEVSVKSIQKVLDSRAESWNVQRTHLEQEISDLKTRNEDSLRELEKAKNALAEARANAVGEAKAWEQTVSEKERNWTAERQFLQEKVEQVEVSFRLR